jgi:hypothetical protein
MTAETLLWQDECARHGVDASAAECSLVMADKDETPLKRHLNAIVPVSFACVGERMIVSAYPSVRSVIDAHFEKYRSHDALFSEDAFSALDRALRPRLAAWGYKPAMFPSRYGISLVQDDASAVSSDCILSDTVCVTDALCQMKNLTSMKLADCAARGAYAQIADGQIVCIASVNRVSDLERCVEIGVECAPDYRRRGYAASCVRALTRDLCEGGNVVLYRHYHTNIGSAAVARAAGFRPVGRFFSYTSFAI